MRRQIPRYTDLLIIAYSVLIGAGVVHTWGDHPLTRMGAVAFVFYVMPVAMYWWIPSSHEKKGMPLFQYLAILFSTIGFLGSLNAAKYLGIAFAFAGITPWTLLTPLWVLSSLTWMPAMAYLLRSFPPITVISFRLVFSGVISFFTTWLFIHMLKK